MIDQDFIDQYTLLLAKQYWEKPKARAEIEAIMSSWSETYTLFDAFAAAFDVDTAIGDQLDILGAIVGVPRVVKLAVGGGSVLSLSDTDYRFFIKVKAAKNWSSAYMVSDDRISINDVVQTAFDSDAFVVNNRDMSLTLCVGTAVDTDVLYVVLTLELMPKPVGVRYEVVQFDNGDTFGFDDNPYAMTFGAGKFASKVIF